MSVRKWSVGGLAQRHRRVVVDANVLIYLLEDVDGRSDRSAAILDAVENGQIRAAMSVLAHAEALSGPAKTGEAAVFEKIAADLRDANVAMVPVTADIAEDAAWLRGQGSLGLVDAVHLATARRVGTAFVTNDRRMRSLPGLEVLQLDDLELPQPTDVPGA